MVPHGGGRLRDAPKGALKVAAQVAADHRQLGEGEGEGKYHWSVVIRHWSVVGGRWSVAELFKLRRSPFHHNSSTS